MTLAQLVYRIASDPVFAAQFTRESSTTLAACGVVLDDHAMTAALTVLGDSERARRLCSLDPGTGSGTWYNPNGGN